MDWTSNTSHQQQSQAAMVTMDACTFAFASPNNRWSELTIEVSSSQIEEDQQPMEIDQRSTVTEKPRPYRCSLCPKSFPLQKTLNRHTRTVHFENSYPCHICSQTFSREDVRNRHEVEQHGDKDGTVECVFCGAQIRERAMDGHIQSRTCQEAQQKSLKSNSSNVDLCHCDGSLVVELEAIRDPLLLCALLALRSVENGCNEWLQSTTLDIAPTVSKLKPTIEILELQSYVITAITRQIRDAKIDCALYAAIDMLREILAAMYGLKEMRCHIETTNSLLDQFTKAQGLRTRSKFVGLVQQCLKNALEEAGSAGLLRRTSLGFTLRRCPQEQETYKYRIFDPLVWQFPLPFFQIMLDEYPDSIEHTDYHHQASGCRLSHNY